MTTTAFFLRCWKNARLERLAWRFCMGVAMAVGWMASGVAAESGPTEVTQMQVERQSDGLYLSAQLQFELPAVVEEALLKGVSMYFAAEADVYRARWYWTDKKLLTAERHMRLAYHPLTRRWRLNVASGPLSGANLGLTLSQNYETLPDAVAALRRFSRWKIAEAADVDAEQKHNIEFRFKLDLSQLPRPFQIGALGQADWNISASSSLQVQGVK
jgi:hypothetical protein